MTLRAAMPVNAGLFLLHAEGMRCINSQEYEPLCEPCGALWRCHSAWWRRAGEEEEGAWRMPWLTEATKDVISCDKLRVGADDH